MGLPAFNERFESLAAETRSRSQQVTHAAEVVSIGLGELIRSADALIDSLDEFRKLLLSAGIEMRSLFTEAANNDEVPAKIAQCATTVASLKRFRRRVGRPYLADVEGNTAIVAAERLEAAESRTVRRLGKRVRGAADGCERQRLRFIVTLDNLIVRVEGYAARRYDADAFLSAYTQALGEESIKRFPVVNAYLAR